MESETKDYSNRIIKNRDYNVLVEKLKEKYPDATKEMAVKKINVMRTSYRRELKKQRASLKSGAGADDEYVPTLWYFDHLSFLNDQEEFITGRTTMEDEIESGVRKNNQHLGYLKILFCHETAPLVLK
ncbi:uncharacterized protein LOC124418513 [Lucilia cuprina]|uniref:uncharacterized protein LOC124418513 n=1 Tax=Lucilia cuprina TaxID=7375 RepID=UPI001F059F75|nr:uncharacterized protein LOC124418513 [Lucilia cuprina]